MSEQKKTAKELLLKLHELEKHSNRKSRTLPSENGVFLLDKNNPHDVEWFENDEAWDKAMKYAKATNAIEGLNLTPEEEALIIKNLKGEINDEEFRKQVLKLINR